MFGAKSAAKDFATGFKGYWRGVQWLSKHPAMIWLLMVPWFLGAGAFVVGIWAFWTMGDGWVTSILMGWFSSWNQQWGWEFLYILIKALVWFSVLVMCLLSAAVVVGVIASPIYEMISVRIEQELLGDQHYKIPWNRMLNVFGGEVLKALVVMIVPLILILIPGVNIFAGLVAAFLFGWDFYDYPLARRGWSFSERWRFVRSEFWTILGFGIWLIIPGVQIVLVPMAVAGGTILNIEALKRRGYTAAQINQGGLL